TGGQRMQRGFHVLARRLLRRPICGALHADGLAEADDAAGEWFWNPELVPGAEPPLGRGAESHGRDRRTGEPRKGHDATLDGLARTSGTVGYHDDIAAAAKHSSQPAERFGSAAARGSADRFEPEARDEPRDHVAVARGAGEHTRGSPSVEM